MGLFSFLGISKKNSETSDQAVTETAKPEIPSDKFVDNSDPNAKVRTVTYGTQHSIDVIYAFINDDYEDQGYEDAMCNSDNSYKDSKKEIIHNQLKQLFEQVDLRYRNDIRVLKVQIESIENQGLIDKARELGARLETYLEHIDKLEEMEKGLDANDPKMTSMILSYERGFLKGLIAKSDSLLSK